MITMKKQFEKLKLDIHCHEQELSALVSLRERHLDDRLEKEIVKIKKIIKAKQDLVHTLSLDYNGGELS